MGAGSLAGPTIPNHVGNRNKNRIQAFDPDGNCVGQWAQFSPPSGIAACGCRTSRNCIHDVRYSPSATFWRTDGNPVVSLH